MATTYNWQIVELNRELSDGYVYNVHWSVTGSETVDGEEYTAYAYGANSLERPEGDLIPFEDLDQETVVEWAKGAIGEEQVTALENSITAQIQAKITPSTSTGLPW